MNSLHYIQLHIYEDNWSITFKLILFCKHVASELDKLPNKNKTEWKKDNNQEESYARFTLSFHGHCVKIKYKEQIKIWLSLREIFPRKHKSTFLHMTSFVLALKPWNRLKVSWYFNIKSWLMQGLQKIRQIRFIECSDSVTVKRSLHCDLYTWNASTTRPLISSTADHF